MNKAISTLITVIIIAVCVVLVGGFVVWQYLGMPKGKISEEKQPEETTPEDETVDWETYRNEGYGFEVKYPENWKIEEEKEEWPEGRERFGWLFFLRFKSKNKEYWYEGTEEPPVTLRVLEFPKKCYPGEEEQKTSVGNLSATKCITKMAEETAWELIQIDKPNLLGYYFEFLNSIYVLANGSEQKQLLDTFNQILFTFRFLE